MTFAKLANGIPLHEASAFFIKLKTAAPDTTGALEGQFTSPVEEVLAHMSEHVASELKTQYAYLVYSQSLRDLSHFAIAEELEEHAAQETEHAEFLLRRMSVLGGDVQVPDIPAPPPSSDPVTIIKTLIQFEQEGIANWQKLRALVGEDNPTRFKIEEYLSTEQEHLDELWQMLPHGEAATAAGTPPQAVEPQAPPMTAAMPSEAVDTDAVAAKTAAARVERFHPDTMKYHGAAMKLALASMSPTVFIPEPEEDEKTAALSNLRGVHEKAPGFLRGVGEAIARPVQHAISDAKRTNQYLAHGAGRLAGTAAVGAGVAGAGYAAGKASKEKKADGLPDAAQGKLQPVQAPAALSGAAAGQHAKLASKFKRALAEMPTAAVPAPGGEQESELANYLATEGAAMQEQNTAEDGYYRQRFTDAMARLQAAEQAQQAAEAQVQQLQEQVSMGATQNQEALAQAQQIQQAAMQQANAANAAAASAMQQSLASSNELLQQQQLTTNMRDAIQALKSGLMNVVNTQLPPSTTMEAGVSAQADQAVADQQAQEQAMMGGQDPSGNQAGTPAASGDAGTPPGSSTPGKDGPGPSPTASDPSSSPAAEKKTESTQSAPEAEGTDEPAKQASDRFIGALMGGALGAGVGALESRQSNDPLRSKVQKLESAERSGEGGFGHAMNLAQAKMRLALGELQEKHPVASTVASAGLGAMAGANAAPHVRDIATAIRG